MIKIFTSILVVVSLMLSILDNTFSNYKLNNITYKDVLSIKSLKEEAVSILFDITYSLKEQSILKKKLKILLQAVKNYIILLIYHLKELKN